MSSSVAPNPAPPQLHPWKCGGTFYPLELVHLYIQATAQRPYTYIYIWVHIYVLTWFSSLQMQPRPLRDTFLLFPFCLRRASFCHSFLGKEQPLRLHAKWWMCKAEESGNSRSAPGHHASCNHLATTWLTQLRSISLTPSPAAQRVTPSPFHPWCLTRTSQYLETSAHRTAISSPEKSHLTD